MEPETEPSSAPQATTDQDEIISWTKQRQQQAQKKIIETLMYSGASQQEEKSTARSRRRKKVKNNTKQQVQSNSKPQEFDVEAAYKSIMGNEYKPVQKKKKNKKKKKRKNKPQAQTKPQVEKRVKTPEERMYQSGMVQQGSMLSVDTGAGFTICGNCNSTGISIPEKSMCFEASTLDNQSKHLFMSSAQRENMYGFCYQAENADLICCPESVVEELEKLLQSWQMIYNPEAVTSPENAEEEEPRDEEAEVNEDGRESDEEEEDEEEDEDGSDVFVMFSGESHMYLPEISLETHAFECGNDQLAYSFSTDQNPKRYLLTYIPNTNQSFLRKKTNILKSNVVVMNCTYLDRNVEDMTPGQISWKQISSFILDNSESKFVLKGFDSELSQEDIHLFFSDLVNNQGLDLSNVVLFIPPLTKEIEV